MHMEWHYYVGYILKDSDGFYIVENTLYSMHCFSRKIKINQIQSFSTPSTKNLICFFNKFKL